MNSNLLVANPTETEEVDSPVVEEGFSVHNEATANWVVRKIIEARIYRAKVADWAAGETRRSVREEAFLLGKFGGQLSDWTAGRVAVNPRERSLCLPAGRIGFRKCRGRLLIVDCASALASAPRHCPGALKITVHARGVPAMKLLGCVRDLQLEVMVREELLMSELRTHLEQTGELLPGLSVAPDEDRFYIH